MSDISIPDQLTDENVAQLDELLLMVSEESDTLLIDEMHGYLTAICVMGDEPDLNDLLSNIYPSDNQADFVAEMLNLFMDEISDALKNKRHFEPLIVEVEEDGETFEEVEGWCYGYMIAVSENEEIWDNSPKYIQELLTPMAKLALQRDEDPEELTEDEYQGLVELIPGSVLEQYHHFHGENTNS